MMRARLLLSFLVVALVFIELGSAVRKTLRLCKERQARTQKMPGNSQLLRSRNPICPEEWKHEDASYASAHQ